MVINSTGHWWLLEACHSCIIPISCSCSHISSPFLPVIQFICYDNVKFNFKMKLKWAYRNMLFSFNFSASCGHSSKAHSLSVMLWRISSVFKQIPLSMDNYDTCTMKLLSPPLPSNSQGFLKCNTLLRHSYNMKRLLGTQILGLLHFKAQFCFLEEISRVDAGSGLPALVPVFLLNLWEENRQDCAFLLQPNTARLKEE